MKLTTLNHFLITINMSHDEGQVHHTIVVNLTYAKLTTKDGLCMTIKSKLGALNLYLKA